MCVCVCVCVCAFKVKSYILISIYMYIYSSFLNTRTHTHTHTYVCMYGCMYVCRCMSVYMYWCSLQCLFVKNRRISFPFWNSWKIKHSFLFYLMSLSLSLYIYIYNCFLYPPTPLLPVYNCLHSTFPLSIQCKIVPFRLPGHNNQMLFDFHLLQYPTPHNFVFCI